MIDCYGKGPVDEPEGGIRKLKYRSNVYNAGVLGGFMPTMIMLLTRITSNLDTTPEEKNCNMAAVNLVIHTWYDHVVFTGYPLNSRFFRKEKNPPGVYILHK